MLYEQEFTCCTSDRASVCSLVKIHAMANSLWKAAVEILTYAYAVI